jgi:hypothetical protein
MTVIQLPDEAAAALAAKAAEQGLSLEAWLQRLAHDTTSHGVQAGAAPRRHIADIIRENMQDVPPEAMAKMPLDGASEHDHYIYGWPKREP